MKNNLTRSILVIVPFLIMGCDLISEGNGLSRSENKAIEEYVKRVNRDFEKGGIGDEDALYSFKLSFDPEKKIITKEVSYNDSTYEDLFEPMLRAIEKGKPEVCKKSNDIAKLIVEKNITTKVVGKLKSGKLIDIRTIIPEQDCK